MRVRGNGLSVSRGEDDRCDRVIYNGFLSGIPLKGDEFFYPNPLASKGGYKRSKWFSTSCCPVNIARFIPQIPQFAYATKDDSAYVNLFIESEAKLKLRTGEIRLSQKTDYPWNGTVRIRVDDIKTPNSKLPTLNSKLYIRIPGWCVGRPVPSDLYVQAEPGKLKDFTVKANGVPFAFQPEKGYCRIDRAWKAGDTVEVVMNMPIRRIKAHDSVKQNIGRLAIERGPVVYCAEGFDNKGSVLNKAIASDAAFTRTTCDILGNRYPAFSTAAKVISGEHKGEKCELKLIPYFAWCHRAPGNEMHTWIPVE